MMLAPGSDVWRTPLTGSAHGHIPADVLESMACSIDFWLMAGSDEKRVFWRAYTNYQRGVGTRQESLRRAMLCDLYVACVPRDCDRLLSREQRGAIERCAVDQPYTAPPVT
jgi:hypothetical protein